MRLRRSVSVASATPGYWTLTATGWPSCVTARWTWPIEAAAKASCSNSAKTLLGGAPRSSRMSFSSRLKGSGGTSSRSVASVCLKFSRSSSGSAVKSTVEGPGRPSWPRRGAGRAARRSRGRARRRARRSPRRPARGCARGSRPACRPSARTGRRRGHRGGPCGRGGRSAAGAARRASLQATREDAPRGPSDRNRGVIRAFGPGRVNLIGEHTDYNAGLALPFAIARGVTVTAIAARDGILRAEARDLGEADAFPVGAPAPAAGWRAFVRGVVAELGALGSARRAGRSRSPATSRTGPGSPPRRRSRVRSPSPWSPSPRPSRPRRSRSPSCARGWRTTGSARAPGCSTSSPCCAAPPGARCGSTSRRRRSPRCRWSSATGRS